MRNQLFHELLRIRRQESPRIPREVQPPADRRPALNERHGAKTSARNPYVGRNDGDAIRRLGQRHERGLYAGDSQAPYLANHQRSEILVATQGGAEAAQRAYRKQGFLVDSIRLWFHYWPRLSESNRPR